MRYILLLIFLLFPASAYAQDDFKSSYQQLCKQIQVRELHKHNLAEYIPNVDVNGNPVTPADLHSNDEAFLKTPVIIPIDIDLAKRYGLDLPLGIQMKSNIVDLALHQDGHVSLDIYDVSVAAKRLCKNLFYGIKKNQSNQAEPHGHESANPVFSSDKIEGQYPED